MEEMINYSKNYFTKEEHDFSHVFDTVGVNEDANIQKIKRELDKLKRDVTKKEEELHNEIGNFKKTNYVPVEEKIIVKYDGNSGIYRFELFSGLPYVENDDDVRISVYNVTSKKGTIEVIVGYNFELGGIVTKKYSYSINKDCDFLKVRPQAESFISFFEDKRVNYLFDTSEVQEIDSREERWAYNNILGYKNKGFINGFYGVDYAGNATLRELIRYYNNNKSFEIILKTAPNCIMDKLLGKTIETAIPVHKILGITKDTYDKAIEKNILLDLYYCLDYKQEANKTEKELLEFIEEAKDKEEELIFYRVAIGTSYYFDEKDVEDGGLAKTILHYYSYYGFSENYSLGKFADYIITETINQGYTSVKAFIEELHDYLAMCKADGIVPTLYSSYLKQTHDIASRNHSLKVEKENEDIFKNRYEDFKTTRVGDFYVVAPKGSNELKQEGDNLNHCVASYIKKVIDGKCLIYFLRKDVKESLITFEVVDNRIVQARGMHNRRPNEKELGALKKFAEKAKMEVRV